MLLHNYGTIIYGTIIIIINRDVSELRDFDIRDEQTLENTQGEEWLLPTESMHGARPRQTGRERPPVIDNPALRDAAENIAVREAAENNAVWNPSRTFRLSPGTADFDGIRGIHTAEGGASGP